MKAQTLFQYWLENRKIVVEKYKFKRHATILSEKKRVNSTFKFITRHIVLTGALGIF